MLDRLDRSAFRELDLRATARGWQVRRERRFRRIYRDPRWDTIRAVPDLRTAAATTGPAPAPDCDGAGTVRQEAGTELAGGR